MWLCVRLSGTSAVVVGRHVETWGERTVEPDKLDGARGNEDDKGAEGNNEHEPDDEADE